MAEDTKFYIRPLTATNEVFNYTIPLPINNGAVIYYKTGAGTAIDLLTVSCGMYETEYTIKIDKNEKLSDYVKTYDDFKALDAAVEEAKYQIDSAYTTAINMEAVFGD